ncbi:RtcB family protein [bacterium]|nr:RtcB family protein [bacterium]
MGYNLHGKYTSAYLTINNADAETIKQIHRLINHPAFTNRVAIMPDTHVGKGAVVGFTMETSDKIVPAVVGVDIGCGMLSISLGDIFNNIDKTEIDWKKIDNQIRDSIPTGGSIHFKSIINFDKDFPWKALNEEMRKFVMSYKNRYGRAIELPEINSEWVQNFAKKIGEDFRTIKNSLGTLGGGNHFIEIGISELGKTWLTIHTGSRHLGQSVATYHQKKGIVPSGFTKELSFLEGENLEDYLIDMVFTQFYAKINRKTIATQILNSLDIDFESIVDTIESTHNYIDFNDWIIRKGAIRSYKDSKFILPFNMRDGIAIMSGLSNPEWNYSAPHGAGRLKSRADSKNEITLSSFKKAMSGIYSSSVCSSTIDESPFAYKDSNFILDSIEPSGELIDMISPLYNMKDISSKTDKKQREENRLDKKYNKKRERSRERYFVKKMVENYESDLD